VVTHLLAAGTTVSMTVSKTVSIAGIGAYNGGTFPITVSCPGFGPDQVFNLADGASATAFAQDGESCTVSEGAPGAGVITGHNDVTLSPSQFTAVSGQAIDVTNKVSGGVLPPTSKLTVTKNVVDTLGGADPASVFDIVVSCPQTNATVSHLRLKDGDQGTVDVRTGDTCTIDEPSLPAAKTGYKYVANFAPSSVKVSADKSVNVENDVQLSSTVTQQIVVSNLVNDITAATAAQTGYDPANPANNTFAVTLVCTGT
jgi:hypothetical protein